jgi:outer membrane protein OmpA-like peptidoglycan-associated protein
MEALMKSMARDGWRLLTFAFLTAALVGCATPEPAATPQVQAPAPSPQAPAAPQPATKPAAAPALPPIMPFNDAVLFAANNLFGKAELPPPVPPGQAAKYPLVIDPLVDGNSGFQSVATQTMESRIAALVKGNYPVFQLEPFTTTTLARGPLLFIGTFTAVDKDGKNVGPRDWFRICLALVDLRSGRIVSKGFARAQVAGVDATPTAFFRDSPAWAPDPATQGYVRTCQGTKVGDPINPAYWDRIVAAAMINDASMAYTNGRYEEAFDLYKGVQRIPGGDQLRVYNGIYLAAARLGRQSDATRAFGNLVDFGLAQNQLAVKFLFRPGSTLFVPDPKISGAYPMWVKQIADRAGRRSTCMQITGHTSRTGPEPLNERLSLLRAQYVKQQLDKSSPQLAKRTTAAGVGSRENISGLGTDDARDALDRRVEFTVKRC